MSDSNETELTEQFTPLVARLDAQATLLDAWELTGGVSARVTALEIQRANEATEIVVVHQHGAADLASNPQVAADEYKLLDHLHTLGLPVPQPLLVNDTVFDTPCIVVEYLDGDTDDAPKDTADLINQMAAALAQIHRVDTQPLAFLPQQHNRLAAKLQAYIALTDPPPRAGRINAALATLTETPSRNAPMLLHGDYWVGNILWRDDQIAGIIDWEDAAIGDPLADLANARLELLWALGAEAMQAFTRAYQQAMPDVDLTDLPYWDVSVGLHDPDAIAGWVGETRAQIMIAWQTWFVAQALDAIPT